MYRALAEGKRSYRGRSLQLRVSEVKKSAEVIVVAGNEPMERLEASPSSEGLNIGLFPIR